MRTPLALLASTALIVPAAVLGAPAGAGDVRSGAAISNCFKTKHGVTVRIKLRVEDRVMRVRVSHPRGTGNFEQPRVARVRLTASQVSPNSISRGKVFGDSPVYRLRNANAVDVRFEPQEWPPHRAVLHVSRHVPAVSHARAGQRRGRVLSFTRG